jgi:hypothetical protein
LDWIGSSSRTTLKTSRGVSNLRGSESFAEIVRYVPKV